MIPNVKWGTESSGKVGFYLKASLLLEEVLNLVFLKVQRVDSILVGKIFEYSFDKDVIDIF